MSFPKYPAYKPSGVEWLGEVPAHWESWKMAHAFGSIGSGTTPPSSEEHWYENGTIPWVTTGELRENTISETTKYVTVAALEKFTSLRVHPAGSLIVAMYGATIGRLGILGIDAVTNQACCALSRPQHLNVNFVYYWLQGFKQLIIDLYSSGGGQPNINQEIVASLRIPAPEIHEQSAIAAFLTRETAKIDALVAEQQKLIALLKEKRQAVISHAVTKGLDPSVPMKDSGVEWLGEVPAHWGVAQFRRHVYIAEGQVNPEAAGFREMVLIAPNHVESGTGRIIELETAEEQAAESGKYYCKAGDVIYSKIRPALRKVCIAPTECLCSADMYPLRPHGGLTSQFLLWFMLSEQFSSLAVLESERVAMPKINRETLNEVMIVVPPSSEQKLISDFVTGETTKFDALTTEAQSAIALLQERRTALISAAVTGKMDVRGITA